MRKSEERILERLDQLIELGKEVLASKMHSGGMWYIRDHQLLGQWLANSLNFFSRVIGSDSDYYREFREQAVLAKQHRHAHHATKLCQGILLAAREDTISGFLFDRESLISADIFDEFLEQAEHLLENKYKDAAAEKAMGYKMGARGLRTIIEGVLLDVMYEIPSLKNVRRCVLTGDTILGKKKPELTFWTEEKGLEEIA